MFRSPTQLLPRAADRLSSHRNDRWRCLPRRRSPRRPKAGLPAVALAKAGEANSVFRHWNIGLWPVRPARHFARCPFLASYQQSATLLGAQTESLCSGPLLSYFLELRTDYRAVETIDGDVKP